MGSGTSQVGLGVCFLVSGLWEDIESLGSGCCEGVNEDILGAWVFQWFQCDVGGWEDILASSRTVSCLQSSVV